MLPHVSALHALLIGIDAYPTKPLYGCVNDIDAIQSVLMSRLGVPSTSIHRLAAPAGTTKTHEPAAGDPTDAAIRDALKALAGDPISEGDRVFIYYSGHGARVRARHQERIVSREAIVPVDALSGPTKRFLFDSELNAALHRIRQRTTDVTIILDCCYSAGITRSDQAPPGAAERWIRVDEEVELPADFLDANAGRACEGNLRGLLQSQGDDCLVVAASQSNEQALELDVPAGSGHRHGALTAALLEALSRVPDARLLKLRWCDLWMTLLDRASATAPTQHSWLMGRPERRVFGGPWERRDPGYGIMLQGGTYSVHAGTLTGVDVGAELAVYGDTPALFPPLDSDEDRRARLGTLTVIDASRTECTAYPSGDPFGLPDGARARLVRPGRFDRLRVEIRPMDTSLADVLGKDNRLTIAEPGSAGAEAVVTVDRAGFLLGDDLYGDTSPGGLPPLLHIPAGQTAALHEALLRYARYRIPLRMAARSQDLPGALSLVILSCGPAELAGVDLQNPDLSEVRGDEKYRYVVREAEPFCIRVTNSSRALLYTTLVRCAGSGTVEILGHAALPPRFSHFFWNNDVLGLPFTASARIEHPFGVDRIIALATTKPGVDLRHLAVAEPLRGPMHRGARSEPAGTKDLGGLDESFLLDQWTAEVITLKVEGRGSRGDRGSALRDGSADPSPKGGRMDGVRRGSGPGTVG